MELKDRDLHVPEEQVVITTDKLKEMIAELLDIEIQGLNLQKVYESLLKKEVKEEQKDKPKMKPMYTIAELQKRHLERKLRYKNKKW